MTIVKSKPFIIFILLLLLAYPAKLMIQAGVKSSIEFQVTKYVQQAYKTEAELKIGKLRIKFLDLFLLRFQLRVQDLVLSDLVQVPRLDLSIKILPYLFQKQLFLRELIIDDPQIVYHHDFSFAKTEASDDEAKSSDFILDKFVIRGASISLKNKQIGKAFTLEGLGVELKDFVLKEDNDIVATYLIKNKELNLNGTMMFDSSRDYSEYSCGGQVADIDFGKLLTVLNGKKQGLSGLLTLKNFRLTSSGTNPIELSQNLLVSGDLTVKDGSLYLLDYIVKTKKVVNSVLPVGKVFNAFEVITVDQIKGLNGNRYKESLNSDSSKFSSLIAKLEIKNEKIRLNDLKIDTPIMKVRGSGYNGFDQKMFYKLEASLANIPILPIMIKGVRKIPVVLIDLHGYSYRRAKSALELLHPKNEDKSTLLKMKDNIGSWFR